MTDSQDMSFGSIPGVDKPVSRLVLGSVAFEEQCETWASELLDAFAALGGNTIDTARHYGDTTERSIGAWLRSRGNRERVVLFGKGGHPQCGRNRVTEADIAEDLYRSLDLLGTDYLDVFLLHRDDPSLPASEIVEWLNEYVRAGVVRAVGGSNWRIDRLEGANDYAEQRGLAPLVVSSPNLSLGVPNEPLWPGCLTLTADDIAWHALSQMPVLAWSSQSQGFFSGRYHREDRSNPSMVRTWYNATNFERLARVEGLASRLGVAPIAVALAWVLHQPFPTFAAIGPRSLDELRTSAEALQIALTPDEARDLAANPR